VLGYVVGNGSSTLHSHLITKHQEEFLKHCKANAIALKQGLLTVKQRDMINHAAVATIPEFTPGLFALVTMNLIASDLVSTMVFLFLHSDH